MLALVCSAASPLAMTKHGDDRAAAIFTRATLCDTNVLKINAAFRLRSNQLA
ncbi:hypothetical protein [Sphingopyxis terrae]|uniref:hypothetical protein n=1 Tax=Sphingopyxis terrae TaxID=33052 RepID=UPI003642298C